MKKLYFLFLFFIYFLSISIYPSDTNYSNYLLRPVPTENSVYEILDYFIILNNAPARNDYKRNQLLTRYKVAILIVEIINNLEKQQKIFDLNMVENLENSLSNFMYDISFIYGKSFLSELNSKIENYRLRAGYVKKIIINQPREKLVYYTPKKTITSGKAGTFYSYTYGLNHHMAYISKNRVSKNYGEFKIKMDFDLSNYKLENSLFQTTDYLIINNKLHLPSTERFKKYFHYNFIHNDKDNTLSRSILKADTERYFKSGNYNLLINSGFFMNENSDSDLFFSSKFSNNFYRFHLWENNTGLLDYNFFYELVNYSKDKFNNFGNQKNIFGFDFSKKIIGKFINNSKLDFSYNINEIKNRKDMRKSGKFSGYSFNYTYPQINGNIKISYELSQIKLDRQDKDFFNCDFKIVSIKKNWYDFFNSDFRIGYQSEVFDAHDNVIDGFNVENHDYTRKYFSFDYIKHFDFNNSLDISINYGKKRFAQSITGFENFNFVSRIVDFRSGNYVLEYSVYDIKHREFGLKNSKILSLGLFYAFYW
ncbi:MAG: hypothetical protein WC337_09300 [Candidatus Muiribacteriota bacterium]